MLFILSYSILYTFTNLYTSYIAMFLIGLGTSFTYLNLLKNSWKYFPDKKGIITGSIVSAFGMSSLIFTSIADRVINPNNKTTDSQGFYPEEVAENVPNFIFSSIFIFSIQGIVSIILIHPFNQTHMDLNENKNTVVEINDETVNMININIRDI